MKKLSELTYKELDKLQESLNYVQLESDSVSDLLSSVRELKYNYLSESNEKAKPYIGKTYIKITGNSSSKSYNRSISVIKITNFRIFDRKLYVSYEFINFVLKEGCKTIIESVSTGRNMDENNKIIKSDYKLNDDIIEISEETYINIHDKLMRTENFLGKDLVKEVNKILR